MNRQHIGDVYGSARVWPVYRNANGTLTLAGDENNPEWIFADAAELKKDLAACYMYVEIA